ncbi:hypothetical protein OS493_015784 [Desmophyllum pertusum]|uniref:Uncharacterized protein n=1 Tax=Desmophyllum pertusum TaxID=174260 RepID=A0A9X0CGG3_9CNID|nr:hypothetical protein OS493_015784 [Desmophyllum pertusum]
MNSHKGPQLWSRLCRSRPCPTVNISHLGSEADVQLAEALVAVSEAVVAAAAEVDDTPRVVAVEETTHSEEDAVYATALARRPYCASLDVGRTRHPSSSQCWYLR